MDNSLENIELRSEKVRNIIGQIPPWIIRSGISLILLVIIILLIGSYYFKFPYSISAPVEFTEIDNSFEGFLKIPANEISKVKKGQSVEITFENTKYTNGLFFKTTLKDISDKITISNKKGFYTAKLNKIENLVVTEKTIGKAIIKTEELSFYDQIITF